MKFFRFGFPVLLIISGGLVYAQTGPGGVGNSTNNVLWLKADAGTSTTASGSPISLWSDQSGNGIDVSQSTVIQQPLFQNNIINGFPAVQFDNDMISGQNDKLLGSDSPLLDNTSGYSFFTVTRPQNFGTNAILSKRIGISDQQSFMFFFWSGNNAYIDIESVNNRASTTTSFSANNNYLLDVIYDGSLPTASRTKIYVGELLNRVASESNSLVPDNASPLIIGSTDASDSRPFGGYIAETIIFREALNKASRIIVNNYLSSKYNISLGANDFYAGDTPGNGNYDHQVAGIGTDTIMPGTVTGSNTSFSPSASGGLGITMVSGFDYGDYVLAGHGTPVNNAITTDVAGMTGMYNSRWERIWYVDITNSATATMVHLDFDMSDGGVSPDLSGAVVSDYVLLYRSGLSGSWTELTTASSISGDRVRFTDYTLTLDGYYTIGTKNWAVSPLPVELISFTAKKQVSSVLIQWSTASEQSNSYFTIERSADGQNFLPLNNIPGSGTTDELHHYQYPDNSPQNGINYYRLKQTDSDGHSTYSSIVSLLWDSAENPFIIYPNPNKGTFNVLYSGNDQDEITVNLSDALGRTVFLQQQAAGNLRTNGISPEIGPGCYIVRFECNGIAQNVHMLVE